MLKKIEEKNLKKREVLDLQEEEEEKWGSVRVCIVHEHVHCARVCVHVHILKLDRGEKLLVAAGAHGASRRAAPVHLCKHAQT